MCPFFKHSNFLLRNLVGNYELAPIYTYESGQFVTAQSVVDSNLNGDSAGDRVVVNPAGNKSIGSGVTNVYNPTLTLQLCPPLSTGCAASVVGYQVQNPSAYYIIAGKGAIANASRNTLPTPATNDLDLTAVKRIAFREHYSFEFQAIAFNVLNHAQYTAGATGGVNNINGAATFGAAYQKYAVPSSPSFLQPKQVFGSNARNMILVAKLNF